MLERLLWTNVVIASSAGGWVVVACRILRIAVDPVLVCLAFTTTAAYYTWDRLQERDFETDVVTMPRRTHWVRSHLVWLRGLMAAEAVVSVILIALRPQAVSMLAVGGVIALTYTARWIPFQGRRVGWKHLPAMKMPFVAILWVVLTVFAPAMTHAALCRSVVVPLAVGVGLLVAAQILLNDLRDVAGDHVIGTATLPVLVGETRARWIGCAMMLGAGAAAYDVGSLGLALTAGYTLGLLCCYSTPRDNLWRPWIEAQGLIAAALVWSTS